jgi:hypothetical protein
MQLIPIASQLSNVSGMETSTYIPDAALPQYQQDSSDLLSSPDSVSIQVISTEARYLIRGDALQVY